MKNFVRNDEVHWYLAAHHLFAFVDRSLQIGVRENVDSHAALRLRPDRAKLLLSGRQALPRPSIASFKEAVGGPSREPFKSYWSTGCAKFLKNLELKSLVKASNRTICAS